MHFHLIKTSLITNRFSSLSISKVAAAFLTHPISLSYPLNRYNASNILVSVDNYGFHHNIRARYFSSSNSKSNLKMKPNKSALSSSEVQDQEPSSMKAHWSLIKEQHPGFMIMYQKGDFFEFFGPDAHDAAKILNIRYSRRSKPDELDMTGIPIFSKEEYLNRLIKAGAKVVIVEQESRFKRDKNQKLMNRIITEIVTPGTLIDRDLLDDGKNNFLCSIWSHSWSSDEHSIGVSWMDISTGEAHLSSCNSHELKHILNCISPKEILVPPSIRARVINSNLPKELDSLFRTADYNSELYEHQKQSMIERRRNPKLICSLKEVCPVEVPSAHAFDPQLTHPDERVLDDLFPKNKEFVDKIKESPEFAALCGALSYVKWSQAGRMPKFLPINSTNANKISIVYELNPATDLESRQDSAQYYSFTNQTMRIDHAALTSLEILEPLMGHNKKSSLFHVMNFNKTGPGKRLLSSRLSAPLTDIQEINKRLDTVDFFINNSDIKADIREKLNSKYDMQRQLQRIHLGRKSRDDLFAIMETSEAMHEIVEDLKSVLDFIKEQNPDIKVDELERIIFDLQGSKQSKEKDKDSVAIEEADITSTYRKDWHKYIQKEKLHWRPSNLKELSLELKNALDISISDENISIELDKSKLDEIREMRVNEVVIKKGYNKKLDDLRDKKDNGDVQIENLQSKYRKQTGCGSLKIVHLLSLGYVIEVTNKDKNFTDMQNHQEFIQIQSLKTKTRFKTDELLKLGTDIKVAEYVFADAERVILDYLKAMALHLEQEILIAAQALAALDVATSLAHASQLYGLVRPIVDDSSVIEASEVRHLVVEVLQNPNLLTKREKAEIFKPKEGNTVDSNANILQQNNPIFEKGYFVPNDIFLEGKSKNKITNAVSTWIITGCNMGGKSTFLRQTALLVIMAQIGSFVPAKEARIGVVDRLFSRIGASDDLAANKSTFMVEMEETAALLTKSTNKSLLIVDEIGRGTSPEEGYAIARSVFENICEHGCRCLFATHFHDLALLYSKKVTQSKSGKLTLKQDIESDNNANKNQAKYADRVKCMMTEVKQGKSKKENGDDSKDSTASIDYTFKLIPGISKKSFGIYVAELAGLPISVIKRAKELLGN